MKILLINCHPNYSNTNATSNHLLSTALQTLNEAGIENIKLLELYNPKNLIPQITEIGFRDEEKSIQNGLLQEFKAADLVMFFTPLHNYNVTSKTKDYIDNIMVVNETFRYSESGPVGLLDKRKYMAMVLVSGSDFTNSFMYNALDIAPKYLRAIMSVMGIDNVKIIRAEGLDIVGNDRKQIVDEAQHALKKYLENIIKSPLK